MGEVSFDLFSAKWPAEFYTSRLSRQLLAEDRSYVETRRSSSSRRDDWSIFWATCEGDLPLHIELKGLFSEEVSLHHLQHGTGGSDNTKSAWLDDREYTHDDSTGARRLYLDMSSHHSRLTPAKLYRCLSEKVSTPAAARSEIFIESKLTAIQP